MLLYNVLKWMAQRMPASLELSTRSQAHQGTCGNVIGTIWDTCNVGVVVRSRVHRGTDVIQVQSSQWMAQRMPASVEWPIWSQAHRGTTRDARSDGMVDLETGTSLEHQMDACIAGMDDLETGTSLESNGR